MNDLVFTVPAKEWTVEEFDRQVRGFKAKLVAFGDVFVGQQPEKPVVPGTKSSQVEAAEVNGMPWRGSSFSAEIVQRVLKMKPTETIFLEYNSPRLAQKRALNAVNYFRQITNEHVYIRTSMVTKGEKRGVQIRRVA